VWATSTWWAPSVEETGIKDLEDICFCKSTAMGRFPREHCSCPLSPSSPLFSQSRCRFFPASPKDFPVLWVSPKRPCPFAHKSPSVYFPRLRQSPPSDELWSRLLK
jgi:hypothetical protein